MKKTRLLPLFSCMILIPALLAVSVCASGFSDADEIAPAYREAVDEMTERGVLEGYPDGSFRSEGTLTREEGAKIVTFLCLGQEAAEKLRCETTPFYDVETDRWSAPYITWCAEHNILHGYGNGRFGPYDTLTADQYAKMLLCALGLARTDNYTYTGENWYKDVREDAKAAGLYDGDPAMESSESVTRGQAALLSRNAIAEAEARNPDGPVFVEPDPSTPPDDGDGIRPPEIDLDPEKPPVQDPDGDETGGDPDPVTPPDDGGETGDDPGGGDPPPDDPPGDETTGKPDGNGDILLPEVP